MKRVLAAGGFDNSAVAPDWDCNPFLSDSILFNENIVASVIAELFQL